MEKNPCANASATKIKWTEFVGKSDLAKTNAKPPFPFIVQSNTNVSDSGHWCFCTADECGCTENANGVSKLATSHRERFAVRAAGFPVIMNGFPTIVNGFPTIDRKRGSDHHERIAGTAPLRFYAYDARMKENNRSTCHGGEHA
ncbi:hypothetical protein M3N64_12190 [Sporolactobacillus sp. CPB3-1]|uniref:Uncharacterized protein n=1 Tax=Sporolactobacillus mangiferae TaxID=2940498 RepID=A0ABT0MDC5_9BACL|nr:hypothetical protein [Sporolactobacillus mangiferae]MCL1632678.1 hypothetical protein [Sporolactobacillus mangiferae]